MEKRKLSAIPRAQATPEIIDVAGQLDSMKHIVTAELIEDSKTLLLYFYEIATLKKGKTEAVFRTFLSSDDYITQDLTTSKVKWRTSSFFMMEGFSFWDGYWNSKKGKYEYTNLIFIHSKEEMKLILNFFVDYKSTHESNIPWSRVNKFQEEVMARRLVAKHKRELDAIDEVMSPINPPLSEFKEWVFSQAMSFSRYLIYHEVKKGEAECECTHCKQIGFVNRKDIRLRNNEKAECPFCGSKVTIKARGKLAKNTRDERWVAYIDSKEDGFVFRYFHAHRNIRKHPEKCFNKTKVEESLYEMSRVFYDFPNGKPPQSRSYEWDVYKKSGKSRWCHDKGKIDCMECILYPGNLPTAWEHTPMKYSALEILSSNAPTVCCRFEDGIKEYLKFPKLEWFCKMGLNQLAKVIVNKQYYGSTGKLNFKGKTIYNILGLDKVNTRVLQTIDGDTSCLRLLQVAQDIGLRFEPEKLKEYYETFECNTELLKQANRKVSLHKLVRYIAKESERYPLGERGGCWKYSYNRYTEREDPRIERKRNMAKDWLEYLEWCKVLKYDLNNMFIYMPNNFKLVHDRTALEYQSLQNKKAAAEKKKQEELAKKRMEQLHKDMEVLFKKNNNTDAFSIRGNRLVLVVPKSGAEIKIEGETLHHCVCGYVERVAKGETNIFFVRKANAPDVPYFTLEFNNNRIIQCRGYKNCAMPPEVNAFVKVFEKKIQDSVKKLDTENNRRKVG